MEYWLGVATLVGIYMIAVLGVSILCGFTGLFSMGHAGFMAIGAYTSALLTKNYGVPIFVGIIAGMVVAAVIGAILSYPTLKLRDDYFIIVTLGMGEAIKLVIQNATSITGGARGLSDIPKGANFGVVWIIVIITIIILRLFINSKHGRNCIAVREEELAAQSVGINLFKYKMEAMIISCALCGCSGALLGHYMHYLQPNMFTMVKSDELVIIVILGGRGSLTGTILAALFLLPLPELLRFGSAEQWRMVLYGLLVVFVILFRPSGLMGTRELTFKDIKKAVQWIKNKLSKNKMGAQEK
ncbi:MAG: branched-chain amino acid ABC transporter permease [Oscillospiraceae bacterium]